MLKEVNNTTKNKMSVQERTHILDQLFLGGPIRSSGLSLSIETLIDVLVVLYDECSSSSLRKEKTLSNFIQFGKSLSEVVFNYLFSSAKSFSFFETQVQVL